MTIDWGISVSKCKCSITCMIKNVSLISPHLHLQHNGYYIQTYNDDPLVESEIRSPVCGIVIHTITCMWYNRTRNHPYVVSSYVLKSHLYTGITLSSKCLCNLVMTFISFRQFSYSVLLTLKTPIWIISSRGWWCVHMWCHTRLQVQILL